MKLKDYFDKDFFDKTKTPGEIICLYSTSISELNARIDAGEFWVRSNKTGKIFPIMPESILESEAKLVIHKETPVNYIVEKPEDFDAEAYWNSVSKLSLPLIINF